MSFDTLGLGSALLAAVARTGYTEATPVQARAIPLALEGHDLLVSSSTGSGKTAAFMLPALQKVLAAREAAKAGSRSTGARVLVLTPTRELAQQVAKAASVYGSAVPGLKVCSVVGGMPYGLQLKMLRGPLDIVIATPGRLIDHIGNGKIDLSSIDMLILDEADRMLDMGFIEDIEAIAAATPAKRQTLMFSATFDGAAARLAARLTRDPQRIEVLAAKGEAANSQITQRLHWADDTRHKDALLDHLLRDVEIDQAIIFTSTQRDADSLSERLESQGHVVASLHGGMPQGLRNKTLMRLRRGELRVLVATDVAARGIDVPTISHVINSGLPMNAEDYVHRIGRTGRAGRSGLAVTLANHNDAGMIRRIERFTTMPLPVTTIEGLEPRRTASKRPPEAKRFAPGGPRRSTGGSARPDSRPRAARTFTR
ncbi:hypothetical protein BH09PSE6_BH09PSE6_10580 [soil metagenome]